MSRLKIVFLQRKTLIDRVFNESHMNKLRQLGDVVLHQWEDFLTREQLIAQIKDADIAITSWGVDKLDAEILGQAPNLKLVLHAAGTVKGLVSDEMYDKGIRVISCNDPLAKGVAETALGLTISALKDMWRIVDHTKAGGWGELNRVRELYGLKIGVVGAGRAGIYYINLLRHFDVDIMVYDPVRSAEQIAELGGVKVELDELLAASDLISIHAPTLPETEKMFNKRVFSLMKDDCVIVNTARGALIDEEDLIEELQKGRFFACLDVTNPEPPTVGSPFRTLPNVILTSHIAGAVNNGLYRIGEYAVRELERYLNGEPLDGEVRQEQLKTLA